MKVEISSVIKSSLTPTATFCPVYCLTNVLFFACRLCEQLWRTQPVAAAAGFRWSDGSSATDPSVYMSHEQMISARPSRTLFL